MDVSSNRRVEQETEGLDRLNEQLLRARWERDFLTESAAIAEALVALEAKSRFPRVSRRGRG
jgi:hypothetical protein